MYDAVQGRFVERDPLVGTSRINGYAYVSDRPTGGLDAAGTQGSASQADWAPLQCGGR
jgi:RHS repeat-associated protein